jgi:hypothetical protein
MVKTLLRTHSTLSHQASFENMLSPLVDLLPELPFQMRSAGDGGCSRQCKTWVRYLTAFSEAGCSHFDVAQR